MNYKEILNKKTKLVILPILLLLIATLIALGITNAAANTTEPETDQTFTEEGNGYYIWVRAVDHAGNKGPWSEAQRVWIDASGPSAPVIEGGSTAYALSRTISVKTESDDNGASGVAYYEYYKKSGSDKPADNVNGTKVTTSATSQKFDTNIAGEYVFFRAVDVVGNTGAWSDGQQVYIDVNKPTVTCNQSNSTLTIKQGDNKTLSSYFTVTPTGTNKAYTTTYKIGSTTYANTSTLAVGTYTVTCTATITGGNSNTATMTVVVEAVGPANIDQATTIQSATTEYVDDKGNTVWVPGGYKVIVDTTVDKGVVIADSSGNEFVWIPIGTITKADGTQVTIDFGRYEFDTSNGTPTLMQAASNYTADVPVMNTYSGARDCSELATSRTSDGTNTNTTAKNLQQFVEKTTSRGGYYMGRYESSNTSTGNSVKGASPGANITQPNAAIAARAYKNGDSYVSADLVNSYMWDTAIVYIQKCSSSTNYANKTDGNGTKYNTGASSDVVCNIYDMSGNMWEWTTEYSTYTPWGASPCVGRGGDYGSGYPTYTAIRLSGDPTSSGEGNGFRVALWVL